jgi:hypothetical protein
VDSGVGFANIPRSLWNTLYESFNPKRDAEGDYIVPCNVVASIPTIDIRFDIPQSQPISLTAQMQILVKSGCKCALIFSPTNDDSIMLLWGSLFLSNFYTTFDFDAAKLHFFETNSQSTDLTCF